MKGKKILVCDDDEDIVEITSIMLNKFGFRVQSTTDGQEIFRLIEKDQPDLLLVDLWMPGVSGQDIVRTCKKDEMLRIYLLWFFQQVMMEEK